MKITASIVKTAKESFRDWKMLALVLVFSPFFIFLMYIFYGGTSAAYKVDVINLDSGNKGTTLIRNLEGLKGEDDKALLELKLFKNQAEVEKRVKEKTSDIGIVIPANYVPGKTAVTFLGSMGNFKYTVAAVFVSDQITKQGLEGFKVKLPNIIDERFLEKNKPINEFESYVPGLLALSVLMILFTATAAIVKENDKKTIIRLKMSSLGAFDFLAGITVVQVVLAVIALFIGYFTAKGLGYGGSGDILSMLFVGVLSAVSMVALSLITACFLATIFDVLTIGCFPFFILMFFSGSMFQLPKITLFSIGQYQFGAMDFLPLTHTVNAFNKILNYGLGVADIGYELLLIMILSVIYFAIGLVLFDRRRLSKV